MKHWRVLRDPHDVYFHDPRSVQTVSERLWLVSDTGNDRVIFIDPNGHVAWQYGNGIPRKEAVLHWPRCARVTGTGNVIIADSLNSSLIEVGPRGVVLNRIETIKHQGRNVRLDDPHDIFLTSRGTLLIVDSRSAFVCEITNDGRALWGLGEPFGDSVLRDPHQAVETEDGEVFIVDPEVGLIRLADQASKLDISKAFFDAQGENIHFLYAEGDGSH